MPNWCENKLTIYSPTKAQVLAFVSRARGFPQRYPLTEKRQLEKFNMPIGDPKEIDLCFHSLVPIPDDILAGEYDPGGYNKEEELWGVKWGAKESKLLSSGELAHGHAATYSFSTPWASPEVLIQRLSLDWSNTIFYLSWGEEDGHRGRVIASCGEIYGLDEDCDIERDEDEDLYFENREVWNAELIGTHDSWVRNMIL
jgi:hypothetical protein